MSLSRTLFALGLGAGAMYLFDPADGRRRRAMLADRLRSQAGDLSDFGRTAVRDLQNRAGGTLAELSGVVSGDRPSDEVIAARVRSRLGRASSHPGAIRVRVQDGTVTLTGHVIGAEVERVLDTVHWTKGVRRVEDELVVPERPETVSSLQGGRERRGDAMRAMAGTWPPSVRLIAGAAGLRLILRGLIRPGVTSLVTSGIGLAALMRAVSNQPIRAALGRWPLGGAGRIGHADARRAGGRSGQMTLPLDQVG